jgi:predicted ATPase/DNA-binding SARP family transcriptional activator
MILPPPDMSGDSPLHFAVLGTFLVRRDGQQLDLGPRLQRRLLAILVADAGRVVPLDRLIDLLWWVTPPAAATASVQAYISELRRVLEPGRPARAPARVLVTQDSGYLLRVEEDQVDALQFQELAGQAHGHLAAGRPAAAAACLADALALWRGDPLAEFATEAWAVPVVARLIESHDLATEDRVEAWLALGGHALAAAELEAMVAARPLRERRWEQLILATYRCGRQADALRAYQRCRAVLIGELGLEPGPGLRRLEAAVLAQDPFLDWHPAAAATSPSVSDHAAARPNGSRPAGEPPAPPLGNLPLPVSSFIGRVGELERTSAALGQARAVTLTGVGGVGKTRLALQVAGQLRQRFADGAWLCELAPVRDASRVDDAVAAVFSVTARAGQGTREALAEFLRGKQLLLVLDNCEHLLAGASALAETLLRSCGQLAILATSREGLGIDGERLVPVPPLGLPGADADSEAVRQADAVRLFADRAAAVQPDFAVTGQNAAAIAGVCRRLDGVPLAIELASARILAMTPAELARRLDRTFAVLVGGRRGAVDRHQTLRAAVDWSFDLLTDPERVLLSRLAVFAGGWTLEAAEEVCGTDGIDPDAVLGLLANLVSRSLVVAEDHGHGTRYRLLETIRQYGEEHLDQGHETERWRARHAGYYASFLHQVRQHRRPDGVFWAVRLTAEQDNLLAAWSWAIGSGNTDTAFAILAGFAPCEVWISYPLLLPGEAALELPGAAGHPGYPLALAVSAVFASNRADVTGAEDLCRRAADANARRVTPDWRVEEAISATLQNIATSRGAFADAARLAEQTAEIARAGGDLADASAELSLGAVCHVLGGDAPGGLPLAREALALAYQIGAPALVATSLLEVGTTIAGTDPDQARACLRESLELSAALGYQQARDLVWATGIAGLLGDWTVTLKLGHRAILGLQPSGDRLRMAMTFNMIAEVLSTMRPDAAAIIQGIAEAHMVQPGSIAQRIRSRVAAALGDERASELRASGADMDWDEAVAYALTQTTQALGELQPDTQATFLNPTTDYPKRDSCA